MKFEAVLCDLDGSLVDSEDIHFNAWKVLFARYGHDTPEGWNDMFIGLPDKDALESALLQFTDLKGEKGLLDTKQQIFLELAKEKGAKLCYPGVAEGMAKLQEAGFKLAVGTNSIKKNTLACLEYAGLTRFFEVIYTLDTAPAGKPAPDIYQLCLRDLKVAPDKAVVLEDSVAGIQAGQTAGCTVLGVTTTWPAQKISMADKIFAATSEAIDWILEQK